jgi:asparagine synthetase B (glutamine-hydrolysing)
MATYKNWFRSNITDRKEKGIDLDVSIKKIDEWNLNTPWDKASENVVKLIADLDKPIFIGLSGGLDSDYVCTVFEEAGINYTPVLIKTEGNKVELEYAYEFLNRWGSNDKAIILEKRNVDMLSTYFYQLLTKCSGYGYNSIATYMVGEYAKQNGGIYVMAEHLIDEYKTGGFRVGCNEWDFYNDHLLGEDNTYYFFNYTPEISAAMIREFPDYNDVQKCKSEFYGLKYRPKMQYEFDNEYNLALMKLRRLVQLDHNPNYTFGTRQEYLQMLAEVQDERA